MSYMDELETLLRARGVTEERTRETVDDLAAFVAESGVEPEEEFGPVAEFADDLAGEDAEAGPEALVWGADSFVAQGRMNELGAQGWEIVRLDRQGRFVSHRDEPPQAWEYRQESALGRGERERMARRLAPEGWEPCGHYLTHAYFKRARAAVVGPEAVLEERPEPTGRRFFWGVPGVAVTVFFLAVLVVSLVSLGRTLWEGDAADRVATLLGAVVGGAVGLAAMLVVVWLAFKLLARIRNR
ncbi:DUF2812 domain-containing protein [Nocardiopsis sp. NPDC058789]|uniref:DUF2812 domain-containing protein n=1 Tax=Nocardiopsis eucommiae TaxID=2831970 RepID=A0A975QL92_9ACTN|nr:DUF2812 domain-containing protein [Nocardiopsis eucommiae]